ncbi:MAG: hypothetical protein ACFB20_09165 [Opitutales bacterium]
MADVAQGRSASRTGTIAMLCLGRQPDEHARNLKAHALQIEGAEQEAQRLGFRLEAFSPVLEKMSLQGLRKVLWTRSIQGLFVVPPPYQAKLDVSFFEGLACTTIGHALECPRLHRVVPLYHAGLRLAMRQIWEQGYRSPGLLVRASTLERVEDIWLSGFLLEREYGPWPRKPPWLRLTVHATTKRWSQILPWVEKMGLDCLLVDDWNGDLTQFLRSEGLPIPGPMGYVDLSRNVVDPQIAGLEQSYRELGRWAVRSISSQLQRNENGIPAQALHIGLPCEWHPGPSLSPRAA